MRREPTDPLALLESILSPGETPVSHRARLLQQLRELLPPEVVDRALLDRLDRAGKSLSEIQEHHEELREACRALRADPWTEAILLRLEGDHATVQAGPSRIRVSIASEVPVDRLVPGATVFLGSARNVILGIGSPAVVGEAFTVVEERDESCVLVESGGRSLVLEKVGPLRDIPLSRGDRVRVDTASGLAFEKLGDDAGEDLFISEPPSIRFEDIGGIEADLDDLRETLELQIKRPDLLVKYGEAPLRAILLAGPPGNGKTMVAAAVASWIGSLGAAGCARFINVPPGGPRSRWYGETEANYRRIFRIARQEARRHTGTPVVIFFDEIDSIGLARGGPLAGVDDRTLLAFAAELDGLDPRGNVLVIAATNRLESLDPALLRPGRLGDCILRIGRPDRASSRDILSKHLHESLPLALDHDEVLDTTVDQIFAARGESLAVVQLRDGKRIPIRGSDLVSGARLANIARRAASRASRREARGGAAGISRPDLREAIDFELREAASALSPANVRQLVESVPKDADIVDIQRPRVKSAISYELLTLERLETLAEVAR